MRRAWNSGVSGEGMKVSGGELRAEELRCEGVHCFLKVTIESRRLQLPKQAICHARLRQIVQKAFTPRVVAMVEEAVRLRTRQIVQTMVSYSGSRFVLKFAFEGDYVTRPAAPEAPKK